MATGSLRVRNQPAVARMKLPNNWVSEGLSDFSFSEISIEDRNLLRIRLMSGDKNRFYGVRPASELSVSPGETARLALSLGLEEHTNLANVFLVLREWDHKGTFLYQVQKRLQLRKDPVDSAIHLTVREPERIVQPALLFERQNDGPADAVVLAGDISLGLA